MPTSIHQARSAACYVLLALYACLAGPPAMAIAWATGRPGAVVAVGRFGTRWLRRLLGIRLETAGLEHVVADRPSVYCINHRSNVDVIAFEALYPRCPRLRGLYKAELGKVPILGLALRLADFVAVERFSPAHAREAVDRAARRLAAGESFVIAPEGTRAPTDALLPFKKGGFVMAIQAGASVVPVAILGAAEVLPRGRFWVKPGIVRVVVGEAVPTAGLTLADRDALVADVRRRLEQLLRP